MDCKPSLSDFKSIILFEYSCWSGLPFPSLGGLPNSGMEPTSPALAGGVLTAEPCSPCSEGVEILSLQFSRSVTSDSLWLHGLQHDRPPCPSPTPRVYSNSCPLSWWCHSAIWSSVIPFSSYLQSFPVSGSFPMSQLFATGGQSIEVLASTSVLPVNIQGWFPLGWTGWISLQSKGLSRVFSNTTVQKHQFFSAQLSL